MYRAGFTVYSVVIECLYSGTYWICDFAYFVELQIWYSMVRHKAGSERLVGKGTRGKVAKTEKGGKSWYDEAWAGGNFCGRARQALSCLGWGRSGTSGAPLARDGQVAICQSLVGGRLQGPPPQRCGGACCALLQKCCLALCSYHKIGRGGNHPKFGGSLPLAFTIYGLNFVC